ncbi:hypothetical protein PFMALIP_05691, partial [Plasmodium falciparum MaliPS096_E11]
MKGNLILSLNNAKDYLKNKNDEGNNVYDHICDIINFIVVEKPEKSYENFELISNHIKESKKCNHVRIIDEKKDEGEREKNNLDNYILNEHIKKKKKWLHKMKKWYFENNMEKKKNNKTLLLPFLHNIFEQMKLINWAGYHVKNNLICYINKSMKNIIQQYKDELLYLRFWGIIKGTHNDYYILEGEVKKDITIFSKKKKNKADNSSYDEEDIKQDGQFSDSSN